MKELKRVWNKSGMRQIVNTPHKTFNNQTNCLENDGNMIATTQVILNIRAYNDCENYNQSFEKGFLQKADLKQFANRPQLIDNICEDDKDANWWLSEIRIFNNGRKKVICYFLQNKKTNKVYTFDCARNYKQEQLISWLENYLFEKGNLEKTYCAYYM